ncbi:NAD(P)-binding protein [Melanomma pulvis-pyrius CBS 109.77]|uniref:NAD(P)-binding protein n=1 Tax=Melanomma pulvis-pyrius CBS 109.77 TaxID=1314802 RepID=A0A6A6XL37_9PLEO|nr:NAD(P)-binding protein [Melanomma pulvis-pyrius CBS 109.77]
MVKYASILSSNSTFFTTKAPANLTAVFVGATNGIGLGALRAFAKHTSGTSPTIYIVGRSEKNLTTLTASIATLNPSAKLIPVVANDLTLIKDAQTAANHIASSATRVDLLIMSPGYISLKYDESPEGLDRVQTIRYYARMRFLVTLAPLLRKAPAPRVVTVLGGGGEGALWPEDWALKQHYNIPNAGGAAVSMMTLFLEEFVKQPGNEKIGGVHLAPGIVGGTTLTFAGFPGWAKALVDWIVLPLLKLVGMTIDEAGERVLFAATSPKFPSVKTEGEGEAGAEVEKGSDGKPGSGVYLLRGDSSVVPGNKVLTGFREEKMGEKVWAHTLEKFGEIEGA